MDEVDGVALGAFEIKKVHVRYCLWRSRQPRLGH